MNRYRCPACALVSEADLERKDTRLFVLWGHMSPELETGTLVRCVDCG